MFFPSCKEDDNRGLSIERMVELGRVSRSSFYRFHAAPAAVQDRDMDLRDAIQRIALQWPSYGRADASPPSYAAEDGR
jgi:hypothetical protein